MSDTALVTGATSAADVLVPTDTRVDHSVEGMMLAAIERGAPVETLERVMEMGRQIRAEQAHAAYFEALSAFQDECPVIPKSKHVETGRYGYNYAPLEVIVQIVRPLLHKHGLSYRFDTAFEADPPAQRVTCTVYHTAGHSEASEFRTPIDAGGVMNSMQKGASAQTYAKRYAFCNALGILTGDDDDDGHAAGGDKRQQRGFGGATAGKRTAASEAVDAVPTPEGREATPPMPAPPAPGQPITRGNVITIPRKGSGPMAQTALDVVQQAGVQELAPEPEPSVEDEIHKRCEELVFQFWHKLTKNAGQAKPNELQVTAFLNGAAKKKYGKRFQDLDMSELDDLFQQVDHYTQAEVRMS